MSPSGNRTNRNLIYSRMLLPLRHDGLDFIVFIIFLMLFIKYISFNVTILYLTLHVFFKLAYNGCSHCVMPELEQLVT